MTYIEKINSLISNINTNLVNFDEERMKRAIKLLKSRKNQIIIFTCHTREIAVAKENEAFFAEL